MITVETRLRSQSRYRAEGRSRSARRALTGSRRSFLLGSSAAALGLLAAGGCSREAPASSSDELSMTWWGNDDRNALMASAIEAYAAKTEGFSATTEPSPWDGYWDKLATQVAGGSPPDWIMMDQGYLGEYATRGALFDLSTTIDDGSIDVSTLPAGLIEGTKIDGQLFAVPLALNTHVILTNETLMSELGVSMPESSEMSWDDLASFFESVTKASGGKVVGCSNEIGFYQVLEAWLRSQGGEFYGPDNAIVATEDQIIDWFTYWTTLQDNGSVLSASAQAEADAGGTATDPVITRASVATFNWTPQFTGYQAVTEDVIGAHMHPYRTERPGQYIRAANYFSAAAGVSDVATAAALTDAIINDPEIAPILKLSLGVPASTVIREVVAESGDDKVQQLFDYVAEVEQHSTPMERPWPQGHNSVDAALVRVAQDVSFGRTSAEAGAAEFLDEANAAVAS